jgi:formylglycine-generating enzyme required for sulfatase activity
MTVYSRSKNYEPDKPTRSVMKRNKTISIATLAIFLLGALLLVSQRESDWLFETRASWAGQASFKPGVVFRDRFKIGSQGPEMVVIPAGRFRMGDIQGKHGNDEQPVRTVVIQRPFAMSRHEITFDQYDAFAKATGRTLPDDEGFGRGRQPVLVSWNDAVAYAEWLSGQTGGRYRLPTEAEWEYAARAQSETTYWWGNAVIPGLANCRGCGSRWDAKQPAPVGSFKPNQFGLYDTSGNVSEWVRDCQHENYQGAPVDGTAWEEANGGDCGRRVVRGGSWFRAHDWARSSHRFSNRPSFSGNAVGFRVVREIEKAK